MRAEPCHAVPTPPHHRPAPMAAERARYTLAPVPLAARENMLSRRGAETHEIIWWRRTTCED
eukprot:16070864-Heterocapsa_arctica.AAC.1